MAALCQREFDLGRAIFGLAKLDDKRRTARLVETFNAMHRHPGPVLIVHDATELDYTSLHLLADDLGQIGKGNNRGYICHNVLAVAADTGDWTLLTNEPAIGLLSVVAVTLLNLRDASRRPDAKTRRATTILSADYVRVLSSWRYREVREDLTVHDFFYALARLGGHQNRKCDGLPGWIVLWRGWMKLQSMLDGYAVAERTRRKRCGKT